MATVPPLIEDDDTIRVTVDAVGSGVEQVREAVLETMANAIVDARKGDQMQRALLRQQLVAMGRPDLYGLVVPGGRNPRPDDAITQRLVGALMEFSKTFKVTVAL